MNDFEKKKFGHARIRTEEVHLKKTKKCKKKLFLSRIEPRTTGMKQSLTPLHQNEILVMLSRLTKMLYK
jgi:hypothetical protein